MNTVPWDIRIDFPDDLQFAVYIAQAQGFAPDTISSTSSALAQEWALWWESLVVGQLAVTEATSNLMDVRAFSHFVPPDFPDLAVAPTLQAVCRATWPQFHQEWGGLHSPELQWVQEIRKTLRVLNVNQLVDECQAALDKAKIEPFRLQIDLLHWPTAYQWIVADNHLVLGVGYLEPEQHEELRILMRQQIMKLA